MKTTTVVMLAAILFVAGCESKQDKVFDQCYQAWVQKYSDGYVVTVWMDVGGPTPAQHQVDSKTLDAALDETLSWIDEKKSQSP